MLPVEILQDVERFELPITFRLLAHFTFGVTGALAGLKRGYDLIGVFFLALISAGGGGLIRDGLLISQGPAAFLTDKSISHVDSCAHDDSGYMSAWTERQAVADVWIDVRRGGSFAFRALCRVQKRYRDLRALMKAAYLGLQSRRQH